MYILKRLTRNGNLQYFVDLNIQVGKEKISSSKDIAYSFTNEVDAELVKVFLDNGYIIEKLKVDK